MSESYRYPGVKPFSMEDAHLFFGRKQDIDKLARYLRTEDLVVLHGKSGLGKSSLINAGIMPIVHQAKSGKLAYRPLPVRFNSYNPRAPLNLFNIFNESVTRDPNFLDEIPVKFFSLFHTLKSLEYSLGKDKQARFLLVLDQFEELFTYPQEEVEEFGRELADLYNRRTPTAFKKLLRREQAVNSELKAKLSEPGMQEWLDAPIQVKILLAIRSDKFDLLDRFSAFLAEVKMNSRILNPLSREQARDAIVKPAAMEGEFSSPPFCYSETALEKLLDYLSANREKEVEGFQLQIICRNIEEKVMARAEGEKAKKKERVHISQTDNHPEGVAWEVTDIDANFGDILRRYYDEQIESLDESARMIARKVIEDELIAEGRRVSMDHAVLSKRIDAPLLRKLVDTRLIRREPNRLGGFSYEISHDTLLAPILEARSERKAVEAQELKRQAELEAERERNEALQREREAQEKELAQARAEKAEAEKARAIQAQKVERRNKYLLLFFFFLLLLIAGTITSWWFHTRSKNQDLASQNQELINQQTLIQAQSDSLQTAQNILTEKFNVKEEELAGLAKEYSIRADVRDAFLRRRVEFQEIEQKVKDILNSYPKRQPKGTVSSESGPLVIRLHLYPDDPNGQGFYNLDAAARRAQADSSSVQYLRQSKEMVIRIAELLRAYPGYRIRLEGHTDASGAARSNINNSLARVQSVREVFLQALMAEVADPDAAAARVSVLAAGESMLLKEMSPRDRRNRRIEIVLLPNN